MFNMLNCAIQICLIAVSNSLRKVHRVFPRQFFSFQALADKGNKSTYSNRLRSWAYINQILLSASATCAFSIVSIACSISKPIAGRKNGLFSDPVRRTSNCLNTESPGHGGRIGVAKPGWISRGMERYLDGLISPLWWQRSPPMKMNVSGLVVVRANAPRWPTAWPGLSMI